MKCILGVAKRDLRRYIDAIVREIVGNCKTLFFCGHRNDHSGKREHP